jgi:hypothetical protein
MADELISAQKHGLSIPEKGNMADTFKTYESGGGEVNLKGVAQSLPASPSYSEQGDVPIPMATCLNIEEGTATLKGVGPADA